MKSDFDLLIVGSGLFGATVAFRARKAGKKVLVLERREHLGGNVYCEKVEGINVHKYGPHIFHTGDREVWDFVNSIVPFDAFINSPVADYHGERYNLPFNMNTFHQMWGVVTPEEAQAKIGEQRSEAMAAMSAGGVEAPRNLEEQALLLVGRDIYEKLVKEYTEKQWGRPCTELPSFIIRRLPVRFTYDNNYFDDPFQGIPEGGYNPLTEGLLEGVECRTGVDFFTSVCPETCRTYSQSWREIALRLVYTGPLDEYFGFSLGRLDWRTVTFRTRVEDVPDFQGNAVVNYTSHDKPFTRIIEHKHFEMSGPQVLECPKTVVSEEYPSEYKPGMEPYYPVNDERNNALAESYRALAAGERDVTFGGRLAEYRYYDMAPVIRRAMEIQL